jgi:DNA-binding winged helix-turn-helix (wHTH) protein/Tol biopolymer transport system component
MAEGGSGTNWEFERFQVMRELRLLIAGGTPVPLTSKAFDTLVVLIENRDRVVTKDELLRSVWPDVEVEEGNLTQQVFLLRKALGETAQQPRCIVTVPGHGYRFTARVHAIAGDAASTAASTAKAASLPAGPRHRITSIQRGAAAVGLVALLAVMLGSRWTLVRKTGAPLDFTRHITKMSESGKATFSAISRDGRYVAYVENDGDQYSLWVKRVGTEGKTPVVPRQPLPLAFPSFSPDGEYLYFTRRSPGSATFILSRIPVMGGAETPVLDDVDSPVSFSPDGREFVFIRGADPESHLVMADATGRSQRILASRRFPVRFSFFAPDWSPDGTVVAAAVVDASSSSQSIVVLPVAGGSSRELYRTNGGVGRLRWLPDGSGLLTVISERLDPRQFGRATGGVIWRVEYPSGRAERLTSDLVNHDPCCLDIDANGRDVVNVINTFVSDLSIAPADRLEAPRQVTWDHPVVGRQSWLPDNDRIVYRDIVGHLNAVSKDGRTFSLPVPDGQKVRGGVSACGDGRYVVFSTTPSSNIWRITPDAGGAVKLTSGVNDFNPACSADGKWVLYASREPGHVSLWRVSIEGGQSTPLNLTDTFDVLPSPSGRMIHYTTDALEERPPPSRSAPTRSGVPARQSRWVVIAASDRTRLLEIDSAGDANIGMMTNWAPDESGLDYVVTRNSVSNIWRQPLTGDAPVQITHFSAGRIFSFAWSPDGRWLSTASGVYRSDVVLMSTEP